LFRFYVAFGTESHKKVFDCLQTGWKTDEDIEKEVGFNPTESLGILKKKWDLYESKRECRSLKKPPEKEYHSSYSRVQVNLSALLKI